MVSILFSWLECTSVAPLPTLHPYLFFRQRGMVKDVVATWRAKQVTATFLHGSAMAPTVKQTASSVGYIRVGSWLLKETMHQFSYLRIIPYITTVVSLAWKNLSFMIWGSCFPESCGLLGQKLTEAHLKDGIAFAHSGTGSDMPIDINDLLS